MSIIKLHDLNFTPFISDKELSEIVNSLVNQVSMDLDPDEIPIFIGILNGSFLFAADFIRKFKYNCEVSFVKLSSYQGTSSSEVVHELIGINEDLSGRTIIILEDIIDTGNTLHKIYDSFKNKNLKKFKQSTECRIIGMGRSSLGSQSIYYFLKHKIDKKFHFVDNLQINRNKIKKKLQI